jgi:transcriptional regulator with XRE-family HTH domain
VLVVCIGVSGGGSLLLDRNSNEEVPRPLVSPYADGVPTRPITEFGRYLEQLLVARSLSLRGFAERIGMSPGWVSRVKHLTIAPDHIIPWADALGLRGEERDRFEVLAWLTHAPPFVRDHVAMLERELNAAKVDRRARPRERASRSRR